MGHKYSFSRLSCFETCRLQYQYDYLERRRSGIETIEAFMGSRVHEALEELYRFVKNAVVKPREWLLSIFEELWQKNFHAGLKIVKNEYTAEDYRRKGRLCLSDYYNSYQPFDRTKIVLTEESVYFPVSDGVSEYAFGGRLDRLDWNPTDGLFEIHDYKTSSGLMTQEDADSDWQLPIYQLALRRRYPDIAGARLIWHALAFNKEVRSSRTEAQLESLVKDLAAKIREIEACTDFPPTKSALCEWCSFQDICPLWKHPKAVEKLDLNAYRNDPGVELVRKYAELEERKQILLDEAGAIEEEQARIEQAALELAERENIRVIDGPDHELVVTIKEELSTPARRDDPEKWSGLRDILIREGRFNDVATINSGMLNARIRIWPKDLLDRIGAFLEKRNIRKVELKFKK